MSEGPLSSTSPAVAARGWWVYLLRCADGSLYAGVTTDLERRLAQHNGQRPGGPRFTRGRRPVALCWYEPAADRSAAQRREAAIKRLSRTAKLALVSRPGLPVPAAVSATALPGSHSTA
ncbi:GIY-YIG nuclease family protein [Haliea atlantica]